MNIIAIQLVLEGTKAGLVDMCKILMVVVAFIFYFPWPQFAAARLDIALNSNKFSIMEIL